MCKIRNGFVSNSSSSSFIIPIKDKEQKFTLEYDVYALINQFRNGYGESELKAEIRSKEDLEEFIGERYSPWGGSTLEDLLKTDWIKELYDEVLEHLKTNESVILCNVAYYDELLTAFVTNAGGYKSEN
jgi:hypothetical protein